MHPSPRAPSSQDKLYAEMVLLRDHVRRHLAAEEENGWLSELRDADDFGLEMQKLSFVDYNTACMMDKMQKSLWLLDLHARKLGATIDVCAYHSEEHEDDAFPCISFIWSSLFQAISATCKCHDEEAFRLAKAVLTLTTSIEILEREREEQEPSNSLNVTRFGILLIHLMAMCADLIRWSRDMPADMPQVPRWLFNDFERRVSDREQRGLSNLEAAEGNVEWALPMPFPAEEPLASYPPSEQLQWRPIAGVGAFSSRSI
ncbi:hypothetical protein RB601_007984 [Gaeumannomyces tritici]